MYKNVASQVVSAQMTTIADGSPFTGTVTVYVTGDGGTQTIGSVGSGICTHEGRGLHSYLPAQAETNYNHVSFTFTGSGAQNVSVHYYTIAGDVYAIVNNGTYGNAALQTLLAALAGYVDTEVAAIKAKTDNLPSDPSDASVIEASFTAVLAALTTLAGYVDTEVGAIKTVTDALTAAAAAKLALSAGQIITGTVDSTVTPTTTVFEADDITEATADHYNGRVIIFTSGALSGQATSISDYSLASGKGRFVVVALTEAPANNDTFIIV